MSCQCLHVGGRAGKEREGEEGKGKREREENKGDELKWKKT